MSGGAVDVIDLSLLQTREELAAAVKSALQSTGFLFIKHHGLEADVAAMFPIAENFFANEKDEEKAMSAYDKNKGYTRVSQEILDPSQTAPDLKEGFNLGYVAPGTPPVPTQRLPALLKEHAATLASFQQKCFDFCQRLLEAFAIAIDLDPSFFTSQHSHDPSTNAILRFLHYPHIPPHADVSPNRAGAHSDYGSLTLLFQRSAGGKGLQILPSSEPLESENWQDVGVVEGALLVNIGDALEFWSGAVFKSTLHRVRLPTPIPEEGIPERFSMAWFNQPAPEAVFRCVVKTTDISENDLARMKRKGATPGVEITSNEHLQARLKATYQS